MTTAWLLNEIGLFATTIGTLLILLYLVSPSPFVDGLAPDAKRAFAVHRRQLAIGVNLLCLWLVIQDIAVSVL